MWTALKQIKKFTAKSELDRVIGRPRFQLEDRPAYYYGGGFVVHYSPRAFRVEGLQRVEYSGPGEYAVGLYHFSTAAALKTELGLDDFEADDPAPLEGGILDGTITYSSTFDDVHRWAVGRLLEHYQEGETRRLVDGKMTLLHRFIMCDAYWLYFDGKSRRTKLSGFQFTFKE
ncbi:hypothetical protein D1641_16585 [Colidextribacter sp. OB.20]|uniref:hypothetical protein n=1 Tax=Colidextribacter sp. OB.20 TaxID=2304568 RepID=UPI0013685395|nr:hypothetical protein [Colidextribacter sp. OB.20]NBI11594.1 hypothetical protein [Colidextribacter sp. OB.20]